VVCATQQSSTNYSNRRTNQKISRAAARAPTHRVVGEQLAVEGRRRPVFGGGCGEPSAVAVGLRQAVVLPQQAAVAGAVAVDEAPHETVVGADVVGGHHLGSFWVMQKERESEQGVDYTYSVLSVRSTPPADDSVLRSPTPL
jgi:hypothetical protein